VGDKLDRLLARSSVHPSKPVQVCKSSVFYVPADMYSIHVANLQYAHLCISAHDETFKHSVKYAFIFLSLILR
jgi:hypothetical protein